MERYSIPDLDIPSIEKMNDILNVISGHINSGHTVYVHCWGELVELELLLDVSLLKMEF